MERTQPLSHDTKRMLYHNYTENETLFMPNRFVVRYTHTRIYSGVFGNISQTTK